MEYKMFVGIVINCSYVLILLKISSVSISIEYRGSISLLNLEFIDDHIGDAEIANHFQDKFRDFYNSVPTADRKVSQLSSERTNHKINVSCSSSV